MKYRRKRSRRHVRCIMCTPNRHGNAWNAKSARDRRELTR